MIKMKGRSNLFIAAAVVIAMYIVLIRISGEWFMFGYRTAFFLTESMEPKIPAGSLLIEKRLTEDMHLQTGDVISYTVDVDGKDMRVTHRIVAVENDVVYTIYRKGDANQEPDPWSVRCDAVEAKVTRVIPGILPVIAGIVVTGLFFQIKHCCQKSCLKS